MSDSVLPHRRQPTRLPRPWDSPGKNTGVGCHFLLQCMKVKSDREVAQSCPTLSNPMDCSLPGSIVHGVFQARVLEWGAIAFSKLTLLLVLKCIKVIIYGLRGGFPGGSAIKNLPAMQEPEETQVRSLNQEEPLEEGMATHSSILGWRIP